MKPAAPTPAAVAPVRVAPGARRVWPHVRRALTFGFFALVAWLLIREVRAIEWREVGAALRAHPPLGLATAAALAFASHLLYSSFDLLGRARTGHTIGTLRVMATTFVSYVFNLNFGALIGGVAFRYRLYARLGLSVAKTSEVLAISMLTNWIGYALLAGLVFLLSPPAMPADWRLGDTALRALGAGMVTVALAYAALCAWSPRRTWTLRGHRLELPSLRFALLQLAMSMLNWLLVGAIVYTLLQQRVEFTTALGVLLIAAVAGVIAHVPAGLGVIEAVFVALLSPRIPASEVLAALLLYRGIYYLVPLLIGIVLHLGLEARARGAGSRA
ncbi:MAG: lysylphosphatidylglycerol synthase domain-containing protein [Burkholderiaceae bacterium]